MKKNKKKEFPYFYARERSERLKRLKAGISKPSLYEDYMRCMSEHHNEMTPANRLRISFMDDWFRKADLEGSMFHKDFEAILLEGWEKEREIIIEEITVSFKKNQKKKYAIIFMAGVVIGVVLVTCLPMFLKVAVEFLFEPAPTKDPVIPAPPLDGKKPEIQLSTRDVLIIVTLRAIYLYFFGN